MPVKMGHGISQTREIDFVGHRQIAHGRFDRKYNAHHAVPFGLRQVGHFLHTPIEYHSAKPRVVVICHQHHPGNVISP